MLEEELLVVLDVWIAQCRIPLICCHQVVLFQRFQKLGPIFGSRQYNANGVRRMAKFMKTMVHSSSS